MIVVAHRGCGGALSADYLTGKNVESNSSVRWMGGYYYKLINEDHRRVSVGLSNMLWHYDKDLSGYTLGQGGTTARSSISRLPFR